LSPILRQLQLARRRKNAGVVIDEEEDLEDEVYERRADTRRDED
jgi:hypothetical protein